MEGSEKMRLRWLRISPTLSDETVSCRVYAPSQVLGKGGEYAEA